MDATPSRVYCFNVEGLLYSWPIKARDESEARVFLKEKLRQLGIRKIRDGEITLDIVRGEGGPTDGYR
jgi:hypothetical protein